MQEPLPLDNGKREFPGKEIRMKKVHLIICGFLSFMSALILFSCADKTEIDLPEEETQPAFNEDSYFSLRVRTATSDALSFDTPSYEDGSEYEHIIDMSADSENIIIFFDKDYLYTGYVELNSSLLSDYTEGKKDSEEIIFMAYMKVNKDNPPEFGEKGLLVLNGHHIISQLKSLKNPAKIKDVLSLVDSSSKDHIAGRNGEYFTMTSSAYLKKDDNNWVHSILFDFDKSKIFGIISEAMISPAAIAYVERMSSKFSLQIPTGAGDKGLDFYPSGGKGHVIVCEYNDTHANYSNRNWTCSVTGWGINKFEQASFYFRNIIDEEFSWDEYPMSYGVNIDSYGAPFFNGWNLARDRRTFWAIDPHYDKGYYPIQYRPAVDNTSLDYYGKDTPSLGYISYNELSNDFKMLKKNKDGVSLYSTENTFPDNKIGTLRQHDIGGSELVIGAQIHIQDVEEDEDYHLYRNRLGVIYPSKKDFASYFIYTFNSQLASQSSMTFRYYEWSRPENNKETKTQTLTINYSNYKLYYQGEALTPEKMASLPSITIPATIENGDGMVIPWINNLKIGRREVDPDTYQEIGEPKYLEISNDAFKSLIYDWIGALDHFYEGKMVYSVPILYKASTNQVSASNYQPKLGDFGVVRNSWYHFCLEQIHNIGNPVDNPDQKIIPFKTSVENSIQMEIKVLDWHEFATEVILPGT